MVAPTSDPDSYFSGQNPRFLLKKGTPREYDTLEFHVSTKAGMLWAYINPNVAQVPPLLPMPTFPDPSYFQHGVTDKLGLSLDNYTKYERALKSYDRKQSLFLAQEKALAEVSTFLNQSVHPDYHWVYWKKVTLRGRLIALKNKFKPTAEKEPTATVPEDESDLKDEIIFESKNEDFVPEPLIQEFLPSKLVLQQKLYGNSSRLPLKPLKGDATIWYRKLAHLGPRALEKVVAKARKKVLRRQPIRESKPFSTICADLFEFSNAFDRRTKALIITCPVIRARISYTLKRKKHALTALMNAVAFLERQFHIKVKTIVLDGETAFGNRFRRWLLDIGISHEPSPPYTKEPAGV
ncbi:hypothetical protein DL766_010431 [Monosporascus sp. MC13-8B]|nr:hypothetical protein DL766_010431 [Monosporascus sp. MC13-8B]